MMFFCHREEFSQKRNRRLGKELEGRYDTGLEPESEYKATYEQSVTENENARNTLSTTPSP